MTITIADLYGHLSVGDRLQFLFTGSASSALIPGSYTTPSGIGVFFISSTSSVKFTLVITLPYFRNAGSFTDKIFILLYQPFSIIAQSENNEVHFVMSLFDFSMMLFNNLK